MDRVVSQKIDLWLSDPKFKDVVILVGMRRVGKTTELMRFKSLHPKVLYFDLEDISVRQLFVPEVAKLNRLVGDASLLLLDEVQYLPQSGSILKLLHDHFPQLQIVVTGSASFLLLKNIGDSLQGRFRQISMYPLAFREICGDMDATYNFGDYKNEIYKSQIEAHIEELMLYGSLPQVYSEQSDQDKRSRLGSYLDGLLFKDVLEIEGIRNPTAFKKLLALISLQIGSEVNPNELATKLEINRRTVVEYIDLFEKFQICYRLNCFSTNQRNEITRNFKVYFSDLGIRNAVISNFSSLTSRTDVGGMFENLTTNVLRSNFSYFDPDKTMYFWRNAAKAEVDLVIASQTSPELIPVEIKFDKLNTPSRAFYNLYANRVKQAFAINKDNLWKFV